MFVRITTGKNDWIKNIESIDRIYKNYTSVPHGELGLESKQVPTIKIESIKNEKDSGLEIVFDTLENRDTEFEKMVKMLEAKVLFSAPSQTKSS